MKPEEKILTDLLHSAERNYIRLQLIVRQKNKEIERLKAELAAAETLLRAKVLAGSGAYHQRINTEIEDYFRSKDTKEKP